VGSLKSRIFYTNTRGMRVTFFPNFIVHGDLVVLLPQYPEGDVVVGGEG